MHLVKQCHFLIIILPGHALVQTGHQCSDGSLPSRSIVVTVYADNHQLPKLKNKDSLWNLTLGKSQKNSNNLSLTGISTLHSSPPILQFICKAILVATVISAWGLLMVRDTTHWLGVGQSTHRYFFTQSYLSFRLVGRITTTYERHSSSLKQKLWTCKSYMHVIARLTICVSRATFCCRALRRDSWRSSYSILFGQE